MMLHQRTQRAQRHDAWTKEEEATLLDLRERQVPYSVIRELYLPTRTVATMRKRLFVLKGGIIRDYDDECEEAMNDYRNAVNGSRMLAEATMKVGGRW